MRCQSVRALHPDPYAAGMEVAQGLAAMQPEAIICFPSVHYADFQDLCQGIADGLDDPRVIIFGGTGDGFYETSGPGNRGVAAMGLNSAGRVTYGWALEPGAKADSRGAASQAAIRALAMAGDGCDLALVFFDGLTSDGVAVVEGVRSVLDGVLVGGACGDDRKFQRGWVLAGGQGQPDAVGVLVLRGDFRCAANSASGWAPVGEAGLVEEVEGNQIMRIAGLPALEYMKRQLGNLPVENQLALFPLALYNPDGTFVLRTPLAWDQESGRLTLGGRLEAGGLVRVCHARVEDILSGVDQALEGLANPGFTPQGALVVSCGARKWILGDRVQEETRRVFEILGRPCPLVGMPSFGEIGPVRKPDGSLTPSRYHNEQYVILFLGG